MAADLRIFCEYLHHGGSPTAVELQLQYHSSAVVFLSRPDSGTAVLPPHNGDGPGGGGGSGGSTAMIPPRNGDGPV